jgi:hypothetical protein
VASVQLLGTTTMRSGGRVWRCSDAIVSAIAAASLYAGTTATTRSSRRRTVTRRVCSPASRGAGIRVLLALWRGPAAAVVPGPGVIGVP